MRFPAVYFDGIRATAHSVQVRLENALAIHICGENGEIAQWPLDAIRIEQKPHDRMPGILSAGDEAQLHFADQDAFNAVVVHIPRSLRLKQNWKMPLAMAGLVVALAYSVLYLIPNLAQHFAPLIPYRVERTMGEKIHEHLAPLPERCSNAQGQEALNALMHKLEPDLPLSVTVIHKDQDNAFALPGGYITLYSTLLERASSADELVGILAHEIGHIKHRHGMQRLLRAFGIGLLTDAMTGGGGAPVYATMLLNDLHYSRQQEVEADSYALKLLEEKHVPIAPLAEFFARMERKQHALDKYDFLSTHPASAERMENILQAAKAQRDTAAILTKQEWKGIRGICGGEALPDE